jgi:iron complex outermembrane receptor protein
MKLYLAVFAVLASLAAQAADLRGKIVSVTTNEPLRQVEVTVLELNRSVVTGDDGAFTIAAVPPGRYTLRVSAVGFRLVTTVFQVNAETDNKEFSIRAGSG